MERRFSLKKDPATLRQRNLALAGWLKVLPDAEDFSFEVKSEEGFTLDQARAAGAQQFLNLGYDVGPVDKSSELAPIVV